MHIFLAARVTSFKIPPTRAPAQSCQIRRSLKFHATAHMPHAYPPKINIAHQSDIYIVGIERFMSPVVILA